MKKTMYEEQLDLLNDQEALVALACLINPRTRELTRIFHCIPSHAKKKLIKASNIRFRKIQERTKMIG